MIDVYRGEIKAERDFFLYAAFLSFFPQLVAGPIERADRLMPQFREEHRYDRREVNSNLILMLWGLFMKMVIADRAAIFVDAVYNNYTNFTGWILVIATVIFAFQIYCDFAGYSLIAMGAAGVMGFRLMENFKSPYCAKGIREFWARWHISLTGWFRDYVYIPLGGNRHGKARKYFNTLIVFFCSGLWHGANWSFVLWGVLNGLFIVLEEIFHDLGVRLRHGNVTNKHSVIKDLLHTMFTFLLVDFTWIFFRANNVKEAVSIIGRMRFLDDFYVFYGNTIHNYVMDRYSFLALLISILLLMIVDICHNRGIHFRVSIAKMNLPVRWVLYIGLIMSILIFGVWGPGFDETAFIYFQF